MTKHKEVKKLSESVKQDIELKNRARRLANLSPIKITVRQCIQCSQLFESDGSRTCGCQIKPNK